MSRQLGKIVAFITPPSSYSLDVCKTPITGLVAEGGVYLDFIKAFNTPVTPS